MKTPGKNESKGVSSLSSRAGFDKQGSPKGALPSIRDYVRLAVPEPEILKLLGAESQRQGTDKLTPRQIDQVIKAARAQKPKRG